MPLTHTMPWPHSTVTFQDLSQTPSHRGQVGFRAVQDPKSSATSFTSPCPSVASCISNWEQKFSVKTSSQGKPPGTPQYRGWGTAQGSSSVGRRRGQRWEPEVSTPSVVYGFNLEAGQRVSAGVCYSSLSLCFFFA